MRKFHRWFGLITGIFMAVISATGIGIQSIDLIGGNLNGGGPRSQVVAPSAASGSGVQFKTQTQAPPTGAEALRQNLHREFEAIHNGEFAGLTGRIVSLVMGFALFFFSVSGIWMYWQMLQSRIKIGRKEVFW